MTSKTAFVQQCESVSARLPDLMREIKLHIRSEEEGIIAIEPNRVQLHYHADRMKRGFSSRDLILKARKHGFTTWKALENLTMAMFVPGFGSGMVCQEKETAARLFRILRFAYDRLDEGLRAELPLKEDRRDGLELKNGSFVNVYTAGSRVGAGRGDTLHSVHFTEVSSYLEPDETVAGITEAAPRYAHISMESTARGKGNYWHEVCERAMKMPEDSEYKLYFYGWWWGDENFLPLTPGEVILPTEEEQDVMMAAARDGFTLTPEQLKWRRQKLLSLGEFFFQEQAEDPETCFLATGNPVFDGHLLRRLIQRSEAALILQQERRPGNGEKLTWKLPTRLDPYIVAVDVAEGLPHGDWSVISTWQHSHEALVQVARTRVKCNLDDLAHLVVEEARLYHNALVAVEGNSIGAAVVQKIDDLGYMNQYIRLDVDGMETDRLGWYTNLRTKKLMIEEFAAATSAGDIISNDRELWTEAGNIVRDEMGRPQTPKKRHDDCFMAACIAYQARDQAYRAGEGSMVVSMV